MDQTDSNMDSRLWSSFQSADGPSRATIKSVVFITRTIPHGRGFATKVDESTRSALPFELNPSSLFVFWYEIFKMALLEFNARQIQNLVRFYLIFRNFGRGCPGDSFRSKGRFSAPATKRDFRHSKPASIVWEPATIQQARQQKDRTVLPSTFLSRTISCRRLAIPFSQYQEIRLLVLWQGKARHGKDIVCRVTSSEHIAIFIEINRCVHPTKHIMAYSSPRRSKREKTSHDDDDAEVDVEIRKGETPEDPDATEDEDDDQDEEEEEEKPDDDDGDTTPPNDGVGEEDVAPEEDKEEYDKEDNAEIAEHGGFRDGDSRPADGDESQDEETTPVANHGAPPAYPPSSPAGGPPPPYGAPGYMPMYGHHMYPPYGGYPPYYGYPPYGGYPPYPPHMMQPYGAPPSGPPSDVGSPPRAPRYAPNGYPHAYPPSSPMAPIYPNMESGGSIDDDKEDESAGVDPGDDNGVTSRLKIYIKPHAPASQEVLDRRARKNAQSRSRASRQRERVAQIELKPESERTPEEQQLFELHQNRRKKKNDRSRDRAQEKKEEIDRILAKPEKKRTRIEIQFLEAALTSKKRKNEGDRLRRSRLKVIGVSSKSGGKPGVSARGPLPIPPHHSHYGMPPPGYYHPPPSHHPHHVPPPHHGEGGPHSPVAGGPPLYGM